MANIIKVKATEISVADGVTTITIPNDTEVKACDCIDIAICIPVPCGTSCTQVNIKLGRTTAPVLTNNGNYWRPCEIKCKSTLMLRAFDDPEHLIICGVRKGGCEC